MASGCLRVVDVRTTDEGETELLTARVEKDTAAEDLWFRLPRGYCSNVHDALLICHLLPAMHAASRLQVPGCASPTLLRNLERIQEIYQCWEPRLFTRAGIETTATLRAPTGATGVATFFTGGVDSFYTLLRHLDEITHIIYAWGFDVRCDNPHLRPEVTRMLREVAVRYGKVLVEVETNIRDMRFVKLYGNTYIGLHVQYACGAALSAVATLLSGRIRKVYVPSSHTYCELFPWSSHPLTDPLWGSESMEFVHDGAYAGRFEKTQYVARHIEPLQWLRVCLENRGLAYNCGRCEKCMRTMIALRALGMLDQCTTFASRLGLWRVLLIDTSSENVRTFMRDNLAAAKQAGSDPALVRALQIAMSNFFAWGPWRWARRFSSYIRNRSYDRLPDNLRSPG